MQNFYLFGIIVETIDKDNQIRRLLDGIAALNVKSAAPHGCFSHIKAHRIHKILTAQSGSRSWKN